MRYNSGIVTIRLTCVWCRRTQRQVSEGSAIYLASGMEGRGSEVVDLVVGRE